jgi:uncharacterized protein YmfQ (DUF2313 family)
MELTKEDYQRQLLQLLPEGPIWPRDPDTFMAKVLGAAAESFARIDSRAIGVIDEADPRRAAGLLDDWERNCGLPDICLQKTGNLVPGYHQKKTSDLLAFSRGSGASYFDATGKFTLALPNELRFDYDPITLAVKGLLIEESRTNLLPYSEQFDNAAWAKVRASVAASAAISPDGLLTAEKLTEDTTAAQIHYTSVNPAPTYTAGVTYQLSLFAKAGERANLALQANLEAFGVMQRARFNLATGSATVETGTPVAIMTPLGNGWYRCIMQVTAVATASAFTGILLHNGTTVTYTGDGASGLYIWGAQLEPGSYFTSYIPTQPTFTSRASTATYFDAAGVLQTAAANVARMDYDPVTHITKGLLLEPAATNMLPYSDQFDNTAWTKTRVSVIPDATLAPDGTMTADKIVEDTSNNTHIVASASFPISASTTYCWSIFAKAAERKTIRVRAADSSGLIGEAIVDLQTRAVISGGAAVTVAPLDNGWFRISFSATTGAAAATINFQVWIYTDAGGTYQGDGVSGLYVWRAQLEAGTRATSAIATTATAVTRAADVSVSTAVTRAADQATVEILPTVTERRSRVVQKLAFQGGQSAAFFIDLLDSLGYPGCTVTEYRPMRANSGCNAALNQGGWRYAWRINVPAAANVKVMKANGRCDESLAVWGDSGLQCLLSRYKPAHSVLYISYGV